MSAIRPATPIDADAICRIYNPYVTDTIVSFEETPVAAAEMALRITDLTRTHPWYVYEESGSVVGYAYAGPWRSRAAYRDAVHSCGPAAAGARGAPHNVATRVSRFR